MTVYKSFFFKPSGFQENRSRFFFLGKWDYGMVVNNWVFWSSWYEFMCRMAFFGFGMANQLLRICIFQIVRSISVLKICTDIAREEVFQIFSVGWIFWFIVRILEQWNFTIWKCQSRYLDNVRVPEISNDILLNFIYLFFMYLLYQGYIANYIYEYR